MASPTSSHDEQTLESIWVRNCYADCIQNPSPLAKDYEGNETDYYEDDDPNLSNMYRPGVPDYKILCDNTWRDVCATNYSTSINNAFSGINDGNTILRNAPYNISYVAHDVGYDRADPHPVVPYTTSERDDWDHISASEYLRVRNKMAQFESDDDRGLLMTDLAPVRLTGDIISSDDWLKLKSNLQQFASACNHVDLNGCPYVCHCDEVCTCECDAEY